MRCSNRASPPQSASCEPTDRRRDDAFSIFYIVFNISAACGHWPEDSLHDLGWSAAFAVAGVSMLLALGAGLVTYRWLIGPVQKHSEEDAAVANKVLRSSWPVAAMAGIPRRRPAVHRCV